MDSRPLLIFPKPHPAGRRKKTGGPGKLHLPLHIRQRRRLTPQFRELQRTFDARHAELRGDPSGTVPEQVLVLEIVGTVENFINSVKCTPDMEWLGELDKDDITPDDDFFQDDKHRDNLLSGRLFLIMVNQQAMTELQSLWGRYKRDPDAKFDIGLNKWRNVFKHLRNIRPWDVQDRLMETGIMDDWRLRVQSGQESIPFEVELWFRKNGEERERSKESFEHLLRSEGGRLINEALISEIAYHGILAELPSVAIGTIIQNPDVRLVRCDQVMFFRPVGQVTFAAPKDEPLPGKVLSEHLPMPQGEPTVALFDGLPLTNHRLLAGRLSVDDPDAWGDNYPAHERHHGTTMASLIIHGELDVNEPPLSRPIYVRPILRPDHQDWGKPRREVIPENLLSIDLVHRAVRRLFDGEGNEPAKAPSVRIINFSIGDPSRLFDISMSPWARLLDWLAYHYKVLFVVSAGNHTSEIVLEVDRTSLSNLTPKDLETSVLKSIAKNMRYRRLLAPAEALNALTVGATHEDASSASHLGHRIDVFSSGLPSPVNALGLGYRRAVKPDILMPGGRQLFQEGHGTHTKATLEINTASRPPGQLTAAPGAPGDLSASRYTRGTSNATALTTRNAAKLYELIKDLSKTPGGDVLEEQFLAVLLKTMLVHGARWGDAYGVLEEALRTPENRPKFREYATRFLGYGVVESNRLFSCTEQRATILGCAVLSDNEAHLYSLPLPPSLSGQIIWRCLTITLAWLTPINPSARAYRNASLWFDLPSENIDLERKEADWRTAQRGTVQHEVLEGDNAVPFKDGDALQVQVNCRADATTTLVEPVPYALAVTLEVAEGSLVPIYEEIRTRIRLPITITPD